MEYRRQLGISAPPSLQTSPELIFDPPLYLGLPSPISPPSIHPAIQHIDRRAGILSAVCLHNTYRNRHLVRARQTHTKRRVLMAKGGTKESRSLWRSNVSWRVCVCAWRGEGGAQGLGEREGRRRGRGDRIAAITGIPYLVRMSGALPHQVTDGLLGKPLTQKLKRSPSCIACMTNACRIERLHKKLGRMAE